MAKIFDFRHFFVPRTKCVDFQSAKALFLKIVLKHKFTYALAKEGAYRDYDFAPEKYPKSLGRLRNSYYYTSSFVQGAPWKYLEGRIITSNPCKIYIATTLLAIKQRLRFWPNPGKLKTCPIAASLKTLWINRRASYRKFFGKVH